MSTDERLRRAEAANELLREIGTTGRRFFCHDETVAEFRIDGRNRVWFWDEWTGRLVYTAYPGRWKHFTGGGTLQSLVRYLSSFIRTGQPIPNGQLGPWPEWYCDGDPWGYDDDMQVVRDAATRLGIIRQEATP